MKYKLPKPIGEETHFVWGPVTKLHEIEDLGIVIVEYKQNQATKFHPYVDGKDTNICLNSLEKAIVWAISCKSVGFEATMNCNHAYFACKILEL